MLPYQVPLCDEFLIRSRHHQILLHKAEVLPRSRVVLQYPGVGHVVPNVAMGTLYTLVRLPGPNSGSTSLARWRYASTNARRDDFGLLET